MSKYINSLPFDQQEKHWTILSTMIPEEQEKYFKDIDKQFGSSCWTEYQPQVMVCPQAGLRQKLYEAVLKMEQEEEEEKERKKQKIVNDVKSSCTSSVVIPTCNKKMMVHECSLSASEDIEDEDDENVIPVDNSYSNSILSLDKKRDQEPETKDVYCGTHDDSLQSEKCYSSSASMATTVESEDSFKNELKKSAGPPPKKHQLRNKLKRVFKLSHK